MKKIISCLLVLTLILSTFSLMGCKSKSEDLSSKIESKLQAYETDINDSITTLKTTTSVRDYLLNWAKNKGISAISDNYNNVIMAIKATDGYNNVEPTVIQCSFDCNQLAGCVTPMAIAMYLAKNPETHGALKIIFTSSENNDFSGVLNLSTKYFINGTNVIALGQSTENLISNKSGALSTYTFSKKIKYVNSKYKNAYKIEISKLSGGIPDTKISSYPNPIKVLGDLLANFKTNSILFELANFSGGNSATLYPTTASMTILVDDSEVDNFETKMDKTIESFSNKYSDKQTTYSYTYTKVSTPKKVVSTSTNSNFVSLLYTIMNGVYYKDDNGDVISITNIGSIKKTGSTYNIKVSANSISISNMNEITNTFKTICSLSSSTFRQDSKIDGWNSSAKSNIISDMTIAAQSYSNNSLKLTDSVSATACSFLHKKNSKLGMIYFGVNQDNQYDCTGTIINYIENSNSNK